MGFVMINNVNVSGLNHQINQTKRKHALNNDSILNEVQPLNNKKAKTPPRNLKSDSLRGTTRLFTSEPYAQNLGSVCDGDILLGRHKNRPLHKGNIYLRSLIKTGSATFQPVDFNTHNQLSKIKKQSICLHLLKELHGDTPRRRFLQHNNLHGTYYEVSDDVALDKISHAIRDIRQLQLKNINNPNNKGNAQSTLTENHASLKPTPLSLATNTEDDLSRLLNDPDFDLFLDRLGKGHYEDIVQHTRMEDDQSFEPIPLSAVTNEEHQLQELLRDPSLSVFLDHLNEDGNNKPIASAHIAHDMSELAARSRPWTKREEKILSEQLMAANNPETFNYASLTQLLPGHTPQSMKRKWEFYLNPILDKSPFKDYEYDQIKTGVERYGKKWNHISQNIFASKRAGNTIRSQFHSTRFKDYIMDKYGTQTYISLYK
jgi:hypothetical protein